MTGVLYAYSQTTGSKKTFSFESWVGPRSLPILSSNELQAGFNPERLCRRSHLAPAGNHFYSWTKTKAVTKDGLLPKTKDH